MTDTTELAARKQQYMNYQLKAIAPKAIWGTREMPHTKNLLSTADNEYITAVGSGIMAFDNSAHSDRKTTLIDCKDQNVLYITLMALSGDMKYLLTVVKVRDNDDNTVHMLVYKIEHNAHSMNSRRPKPIQYRNKAFIAGNAKFEFTCAAFSDDSLYFACGSNVPAVGVVVFDHMRSCVFQTLSTDSSPLCITFNPDDSTKICVSGENALFKYWRFTAKSVHVAPVVGLKQGHYKFTEHVWVAPYSEGLMIAGSDSGFLSLIVGCERKGKNVQAFGFEGMSAAPENAIRQILIRGDLVLAVSGGNCVAAYELRRVMHSKGINSLSPSLMLLKKVRMCNVERFIGLQWCLRDSVTSLAVMGMSPSSVFQVEMVTDSDMADASNNTAAAPATTATIHSPLSRNSGGGGGDDASLSEASTEEDDEDKWLEISNEKNIFRFHSGAVHSLSQSSRTNVILSNSFDDGTIRVWDYNRPTSFRGSWIVEQYKERPQDNPFSTAMHPSGLFAAFAVEGEVREYAITDSSLDLYRRISVRAPFTGPSGAAHLITQPVSLVKYSNGGHYIAVVTGKIAQIFHLHICDFTSHSHSVQAQRLMVLSDHNAPITDLDFFRDDSMLVTTSSDGSVYSWRIGASSREQEYVAKGVPATRLCISKHRAKGCSIMVAYEMQNESKLLLAAEVARTRRRSSLNSRRMSRMSGSNAHGSHLIAAENGSHDFTHSPLRHIINEVIGENSTASVGNEQQSTAPAATTTAAASGGSSRKKPFLAVWKNQLTASPQILYLETPVRSIAIGESDGPDHFEFCVLGLADGRILISFLPLPGKIIDPTPTLHQPVPHSNTATGAAASEASSSKKLLLRVGTASKHGMRRKGSAGPMELSAMRASLILNDASGEFTSAFGSPAAAAAVAGSESSPNSPSHFSATRTDAATLESDLAVAAINTAGGAGTEDDTGSANAGVQLARNKEMLDEGNCRSLRMHCGAVSHAMISKNGMWIFTAGEDGTVFMYGVTKRAMELPTIAASSDNLENKFLMVDKTRLQGLITQLLELQHSIEQSKKDYALKVEKIVESRKKIVDDLEARRKREIKHRDEAIVSGRQEYLKLKNAMSSEISSIRKQCKDTIAELELMYEQKLAHESLYLEKMKQAYDEYVLHAQMDLQELRGKTEARVAVIETEKQQAMREAEKQKGAVLKYFEYIQLRNDELYQSLEEKQVEERCKLKGELDSTQNVLQKAQGAILTGEVQANREITKLQSTIDEKESEVLKLRSDVDWANNRIMQLEHTVQQATAELGSRTEMSEKWELKAGEMQQKIIELEKLRKALTTQLHSLRQELGPKEDTLLHMTDKLQETEREYEHAMHAIAEKEKSLNQKAENLNLLQKQVRELRNASSRKEKVLRRAATLLDEYRFALQQAYFRAEKRTVHQLYADATAAADMTANAAAGSLVGGSMDDNTQQRRGKLNSTAAAAAAGGEVVEIIAQNDGMKTALKRLTDVLTPFLNEENIDAELMDEMEVVRKEQERHMNLLHRSVSGLRANLEFQQSVASVKVAHHLTDNQNLLKEVNSLRLEVRNLSLENQRLSAQLEFNNTSSNRKRTTEAPPPNANAQQLQTLYEQQLEYSSQLQQQLREVKLHAAMKMSADELKPFSAARSAAATTSAATEEEKKHAFKSSAAATAPTARSMQKSASAALAEDRHPSQSAFLSALLSQTAPAMNASSSAATAAAKVSSGNVVSKNEFSTAADEKIAALMEMNSQEIKALTASNQPTAAAVDKKRNADSDISGRRGTQQQQQNGRSSGGGSMSQMELTGLSITSADAASAAGTPVSGGSSQVSSQQQRNGKKKKQQSSSSGGERLPPVAGTGKFGLKSGRHIV